MTVTYAQALMPSADHPARASARTSVRRTYPAFTLIEVLVVVAIIALLVAILLPSLRYAREQAEKVTCGSNLHQMGLGLANYADDHKGLLPYRGWFTYTIAETMHEALGQNPRDQRVAANLGLLYPRYIGNNWDVLYCTKMTYLRDMETDYDGKRGGLKSIADPDIYWSYGGYNYAPPMLRRGHSPNLHSKNVYPADEVEKGWAELIETKTDGASRIVRGMQALVSDWGIGGVPYVHRSGVNVLYSDLHVRYIQTEDYHAGSGSEASFELWYYLTMKR